ncbi:MAG: pepsin-like aspartyl protease [Janthinobacterium lividum]
MMLISVRRGYSTPIASLSTSTDLIYKGGFIISCDATAPTIGIQINGTVFTIDPVDMILYGDGEVCITGVQDGGAEGSGALYILGDVFLKNVVAVYDLGAEEMSFAAREFY